MLVTIRTARFAIENFGAWSSRFSYAFTPLGGSSQEDIFELQVSEAEFVRMKDDLTITEKPQKEKLFKLLKGGEYVGAMKRE